jgi:hypothetical protein
VTIVVFCGVIGSLPHISPILQKLDWNATAVQSIYSLGLIPEDSVPGYEQEMRSLTPSHVIDRLLAEAIPEQRAKLNVGSDELMAIISVTDNFGRNHLPPFCKKSEC